MDEHPNVRAIAKNMRTTDSVITYLKKTRHKFSVDFKASNGQLSMARFRNGKTRIYFIVNSSKEEITFTATSEDENILKIYNPVNGNIRDIHQPLSEKIGGYESILVVE